MSKTCVYIISFCWRVCVCVCVLCRRRTKWRNRVRRERWL